MKTNIEALQALYVALGGQLTDTHSTIAGGVAVSAYQLSSDVILAIAEIATPLPAVDADDNGKVLKVVEGEWAVGADAT